MNLGEILSGVALLQPLAPELAQAPVAAIEFDSRRVSSQSLFFAFPGSKVDGRQFAADALARGALAVVCESPAPPDFAGRWIQVAHGRRALSLAARN
ncbi:MAG: Mur ligase domain-containing protein, partial [Candidatus Solibacter sp.]|nr:Mur ligase domain-containing protein [Candidatus Solibacter sp.]